MAVKATQTQLIPFSELAPGQASAIRNEAVNFIVGEAVKQLKLAEEKLIVRDIRADIDLDYATEDWSEVSGTTAATYETMSTGTMADQRWVGIFGVKISPNSVVSALRLNIGGADRVLWQLQSLGKYDDYVGFTPFVALIPPNTPYTISRYVTVASSPAFCLLKGVVVEPRGRVVSP